MWPAAVSLVPGAVVCGPSGDLASLPGFGSVPPKLIKKILAKEYVDIWELLPDTWQVEADGPCCHTKRPRRSLITDVTLWTECYATMAAILASAFPSKAPHFFAYLRTITKASRTFESSAWASYDMAYRRQAANRGSLDWGVVDAALYSEAFAGRAKWIPRCRYCLADTHSSQECAHAPGEATIERADGRPLRGLPRQPGSSGRVTSAVDICRLYNSPSSSRCRFQQCRFAHLCAKCKRPHPAAECGGERRQPTPTPQPTATQGGARPPTS